MSGVLLLAAHNEAENIEPLYRSAIEGTQAPDEIIVIDNLSNDGTGEIARSLGCTVLECTTPGQMPALQTGFRMLAERRVLPDAIHLTDADVVLAADCHERMTTAETKHPEIRLGGVRTVYPETLHGHTLQTLRNAYIRARYLRDHWAKTPLVNGPNFSFVRPYRGNLNVMASATPRGYANDVFMYRLALESGLRLTFARDALVYASGDRYPMIRDFVHYVFDRSFAYKRDPLFNNVDRSNQ